MTVTVNAGLAQKRWGFDLCYFHLRIVKGFLTINHKRIYGIYRELGLNHRIRPKRRIKGDKRDPLSVHAEESGVVH